MKTTTLHAKSVKLELDSIAELAAEASVSTNRHVTWMKLILTDDKPNANNMRVPREEYANILRTGLFMPVKSAYGKISKGHRDTFPVGVMTHLKVNGDEIESLAALWDSERSEDISELKRLHDAGEELNVSWELTYTDEEEEPDGVIALRNICMNAATLVGVPAYAGRTPVVAISSIGETEQMEETTIVETPAEKQELVTVTITVSELDALKAELATVTITVSELDALKAELAQLKEFKSTIEKAEAEAKKLESIKQKFSAANIKVAETYFDEKRDMLVALEEDQVDFFVQELVAAFASKDAVAAKTPEKVSITSGLPVLGTSPDSEVTLKDIVEYLKSKK